MRQATIALAAIALAGATSAPTFAESPARFRGLFEGIDPQDGSLTQRQITCTNSGSSCSVLGADTFFSFCPGAEGRGILAGEGEIVDGVLVVPNFTLTCADGSEISVSVTFTPDDQNQALIDRSDDPDIPPVTLHRVNGPLRLR